MIIISVEVGIDISAYANIEIEADNPTEEEIKELVSKKVEELETSEELYYAPDWDTSSSLRIVRAIADGQTLFEDLPIEQTPYDAGLLLSSALQKPCAELFMQAASRVTPSLSRDEVKRALQAIVDGL